MIHSITAVYSGDSSYGPATSSVLSENVVDFTIVPQGGGAASVPAASVASFPLVISPVGASTLPGSMSLGVTGLSLGATASFSPSSVNAGSGPTSVTLQVTLPGKAALEQPRAPFSRKSLPLALSLILLPFAARLRKTARRWRSLFVLALLAHHHPEPHHPVSRAATAVSILLLAETWTPSGIFLKKMPPRMNFKWQHLNRNRSNSHGAV